MKLINFLTETNNRTLFHGTTITAAKNIMQNGLQAGIGDFVKHAYGTEGRENEGYSDLVFAADKQGLRKAMGAMLHHVSKIIDIPTYRVSERDFLKHAALVIIKKDTENFTKATVNHMYYNDTPSQVEPDDYYSETDILADFYISGKRLRSFLTKYGVYNWKHRKPE